MGEQVSTFSLMFPISQTYQKRTNIHGYKTTKPRRLLADCKRPINKKQRRFQNMEVKIVKIHETQRRCVTQQDKHMACRNQL
jgi:hypothetical protein